MLRLITVDVNSSLIRVRGSVGQLYSKAAKEFGHYIDAKVLESAFQNIYQFCKTEYPNFGIHDNISTRSYWHEIVCTTFKNSGCTVDEDGLSKIASALYDDFTLPDYWEVFDDVPLVLNQLKQRGYILGVVSNFDERLPVILKRLDIVKYFSFVLCSTEVKVAKPSPKIFQLALQSGGADASEALHVGDSVAFDYNAAKAVGMSAFLMDRFSTDKKEKDSVDPSHIITSLKSLLEL